MIPKNLIEKLVNNGVYVYIRGINIEFAGVVKSITEDDIVVLEDNKNNLINIPLSLIDVITERRWVNKLSIHLFNFFHFEFKNSSIFSVLFVSG